jgi:hypothetical protein
MNVEIGNRAAQFHFLGIHNSDLVCSMYKLYFSLFSQVALKYCNYWRIGSIPSVVEDTLASVEAVVRTQDKQGFRLLDKPKSFYFHDKSSGKNAVG